MQQTVVSYIVSSVSPFSRFSRSSRFSAFSWFSWLCGFRGFRVLRLSCFSRLSQFSQFLRFGCLRRSCCFRISAFVKRLAPQRIGESSATRRRIAYVAIYIMNHHDRQGTINGTVLPKGRRNQTKRVQHHVFAIADIQMGMGKPPIGVWR